MSGQTIERRKRKERSTSRSETRARNKAKKAEVDARARARWSQRGVLCCRHQGCTRTFNKKAYLDKHMQKGKHNIPVTSTLKERSTQVAQIQLEQKYVTSSSSVSQVKSNMRAPPVLIAQHPLKAFEQSWALVPYSKPTQKKTLKVKQWLVDLFEKGEASKQKVNREANAMLMSRGVRPNHRKPLS